MMKTRILVLPNLLSIKIHLQISRENLANIKKEVEIAAVSQGPEKDSQAENLKKVIKTNYRKFLQNNLKKFKLSIF